MVKIASYATVPVQPVILDWAENRSLQDGDLLRTHFPRLDDWKEGLVQPTLKQLKDFATFTHTPFALRSFIAHADDAGILVMRSGVVGNNNHRTLDPQEFRGFALADALAPLIFINGSDSKSAQMFTLAHELAHIWLCSTALSDVPIRNGAQNEKELWCNKVAAEILGPLSS